MLVALINCGANKWSIYSMIVVSRGSRDLAQVTWDQPYWPRTTTGPLPSFSTIQGTILDDDRPRSPGSGQPVLHHRSKYVGNNCSFKFKMGFGIGFVTMKEMFSTTFKPLSNHFYRGYNHCRNHSLTNDNMNTYIIISLIKYTVYYIYHS